MKTASYGMRKERERVAQEIAVKKEYGLSQSALSRFLECTRKARLSAEGWSLRRRSDARSFGTLGHACLESGYLLRNPKRTDLVRLVGSLGEATEKVHGSRWSEKELQEHELAVTQLEVLVPAYFEFYAAKDKGKVKWQTESSFRVPFAGTFLIGYIDLVKEIAGRHWIFDTKFKGRVEDVARNIEILTNDFQLLFYALAYRLLTGKAPAGVMYNIVRRPGIDPKVGESLKQYQKRLSKEIDKKPSHYFKRFEIPIRSAEIDRFGKYLEGLIQQYHAWKAKGMPGEIYGKPCFTRYGVCDFAMMCHANNKTPYEKRKNDRTQGESNALKVEASDTDA